MINSFGLQNALERNAIDLGHFFVRCHATASKCATLLRDKLGPLGYLKYSPDSHFVQCSYAVLSLMKVRCRPEGRTRRALMCGFGLLAHPAGVYGVS